ncbi:MAG: transporter substrate-binding domain-containing protein [Chitinivibrionales bacterium]|nr:transporter substrate-binding domain-containing protein [Chitinivibrionales bacterium]
MPRSAIFTIVVFCLSFLYHCSQSDSRGKLSEKEILALERYKGRLDTIKAKDTLRVISPDISEGGLPREGSPLSFEQDMSEYFAEELGVELLMIHPESYDSIIPWLVAGIGDIAAASLTETERRQERVDFTRPLNQARELLIGRKELADSIISIDDLHGREVVVRRSSTYYQTLQGIKDSIADLKITLAPHDMHTEEIVHRVATGKYPLTLCDSHLARNIFFYEETITALLELTDYRPIAWAVARECPDLLAGLNEFILEQKLTKHLPKTYTGDWEGILKRKVLRIATRNNAATYWIYRGKEVGFEYELCKAFAKKHKLRIEMQIAPDWEQLLQWVHDGKADIAAACITATAQRRKLVDFAEPHLFATEVVVSGLDSTGTPFVTDTADLHSATLYLRRSSSYYQSITQFQSQNKVDCKLEFVPEDMETEEILSKVAAGEFQATICDDYIARMEQMHTSDIEIAFPVSDTQHIAWAIRQSADTLQEQINTFFTETQYRPRDKMYNITYNKYFESRKRIAAARSLHRADKEGTISPYDRLMKRYAKRYDFDWRMVAAQTYQESKFNPNARSWAGAVGLMQIMPSTGRDLRVGDISKPGPSLHGGTKYMRQLLRRFEKGIPFQERYRFALASYNAGYGHVIDARRLAQSLGLNSDVWFDNVEQAMLKLAKPEYARKARYGYCRGSEPVMYVGNIQRLYNHYSQVVDGG